MQKSEKDSQSTKNGQNRAKPVPKEFSDAMAWAAWLYFVDELTQNEIAQKIGVSRVTVIKMLNDAKARGLVSIRMHPNVMSRTMSSRRLAEKFELNSVTIVPDLGEDSLIERLGKAGAFALKDIIAPGDVIGVAWGKTVLAVAEAISIQRPIDDLTVVQVTASPNGLSADFSPELCASLMANKLGARGVSLLTPARVSSPDLKAMLLEEPSIKNQFDIIRSANKVVFGIGDMSEQATLRISDLYAQYEIDQMIKKGAVSVILGTFIDENGHQIPGPQHDRELGITLQEFKTIPYRLCVAGGERKTAAIKAALAGRLVTDLIIDQKTAERIAQ